MKREEWVSHGGWTKPLSALKIINIYVYINYNIEDTPIQTNATATHSIPQRREKGLRVSRERIINSETHRLHRENTTSDLTTVNYEGGKKLHTEIPN